MTSAFKKTYASFIENPSIWFFYAFLATSTLSIRKVLFFYPINDSFNEHTGIYIYLSDIFLFLTLLAWILYLCNNLPILSIVKQAYQQVVHSYLISFPLFLAIFSFISILWANNQGIALFRSIKILEFVSLYYFVIYTVSNSLRFPKMFHACPKARNCSTWNNFSASGGCSETSNSKCSTWNILRIILLILIICGFIQGLIGISQFILQHSLSLLWLKESIIAPDIPGVAKVIFNNQTYIRSYGLFPHPNILAGFQMLSILALLSYLKMFHVEHSVSSCQNVPRGTFLSESNVLKITNIKSKLLSHFSIIFYKFGKMIHIENKCSTWNIYSTFKEEPFYQRKFTAFKISATTFSSRVSGVLKMFHVEHFESKTILLHLILIILALSLSVSFSKSAIIGLFIGFFYMYVSKCSTWNILNKSDMSTGQVKKIESSEENTYQANAIVPRGTIFSRLSQNFHAPFLTKKSMTFVPFLQIVRRLTHDCKMFHVEHLGRMLLMIASILLLSGFLLKTDSNVFFQKSLREREFYLNVSRGTFFEHPYLGMGAGQFVTNLKNVANIESWQFQPVHNVFLLILNEYGIFMFAFFIIFIFKIFSACHVPNKCSTPAPCLQNVPRGTICKSAGWNNLQICGVEQFSKEGTESKMFHACSVATKCSTWNISSASGVEHFAEAAPIYPYLKAILLSFTFIMLFDHYFWDIQQGQMMLWFVLGILAANRNGYRT